MHTDLHTGRQDAPSYDMDETRTPRKPRQALAAGIVAVVAILGLGLILMSRTTGTSTTEAIVESGAAVVAIAPLDPAEVPSENCVVQTPCLRQWYQTLTWEIGPEAALHALERHGESNPTLRAACHDTTHSIGEVAAYMRPISEAMSLGDSNCGSGYYHGVIATTTTKVAPEHLVDTLIAGCSDGEGFARWECFHGVGHGFVFAAGGNIYRGIEKCLLILTDYDRGACGSGAFMQELADHGQDEKYDADPYVVCKDMNDPVVAGQCYDMLANIVYIHRDTPEAQFDECSKLEEPYTSDCYRGLGRARFAGLPFEGVGIEAYCNAAGGGEKSTLCYEAAFSNTAAYYGNNEEAASHCPELSTDALRALCRTWFTENPLG